MRIRLVFERPKTTERSLIDGSPVKHDIIWKSVSLILYVISNLLLNLLSLPILPVLLLAFLLDLQQSFPILHLNPLLRLRLGLTILI
jgi:hypothetical protein